MNLDEIQATPEILGKLRWFAEDLPKLHVVAAGSLLDFALAEHSFSMMLTAIRQCQLESAVPSALHVRLLELVRSY